MGTPQFAAKPLKRLIIKGGSQWQVVGVVTGPDRPRGRGLEVTPTPVAEVGAASGVPVLKPTSMRDQEFVGQLRALAPDLLVVVAYGKILPKEVLEIPRIMPLNVHASLLPRHRGASPVEAAILAGDTQTGITLIRMTEQMDAGPVLMQVAIPILPGDTQGSLKERLSELAADTLEQALPAIAKGELAEAPQDETQATYCKPIKKQDAWIDWSKDCVYIERMTRAYDPWPVARSRLSGKELLIFRAEALPDQHQAAWPGTVVEVQPEPVVACGQGALKLLEVQLAGKRRVSGGDLVRGRHLQKGQRLGS